eukprot:SAG25_NODE_710_length_5815_cov_9.003149_8_plen_259_part_00
MNEQKIKLASEYLGMPGVPVKNRDNKSKTDGLKPVAKLEYESIRANPGDEVQAKTITDALTSVVRENIHALWALVPAVYAITQIGAHGFEIPHVNEMKFTQAIKDELLVLITGDRTTEKLKELNNTRLAKTYGIQPESEDKWDWIIEPADYQDKVTEFCELATIEFATANKTLAGWMEDSQLGKMADVMRIITGKWHGECGEKAYRRVIKATMTDALSIWRVFLLETEVYRSSNQLIITTNFTNGKKYSSEEDYYASN